MLTFGTGGGGMHDYGMYKNWRIVVRCAGSLLRSWVAILRLAVVVLILHRHSGHADDPIREGCGEDARK